MRQAPAVVFPVTRSRWHLRLGVLLSLLGLAAVAAIAVDQSLVGMQLLVLGCVAFASCGAALRAWQQSPAGHLRWDGQEWFWSGLDNAHPCRAVLRLDVQSCILLSLHAPLQNGGRLQTWLWLDATPELNGAQWLALRRALLSSQALHHRHNQPLESAP